MPHATDKSAYLEVNAQLKKGVRWKASGGNFYSTMTNPFGTGLVPQFMAVFLDSGDNNVNRNYPAREPWKKSSFRKATPISLWEGEDGSNSISTAFKVPVDDVCKSQKGVTKVWYWYSDIFWDDERAKLPVQNKITPALLAGYEIKWSFSSDGRAAGSFDEITVSPIGGLPIAGDAAIQKLTGLDIIGLVKCATGYTGFDPHPPIPAKP